MQRKLISSGSDFEEKIGYSRAVADGDYVFVAGTTGYDYRAMTISDDVVAQAEQCLRNIGEALAEAGSGFDRVVRVNYIFAAREDFPRCWHVFRKYFGESRPASTMLVAGFADEKMKVEIEVTARAGRA
ncbi:MAG: RidA family protein [Gammaproteobacteria bacterium]|nr:RidA family protein [Gammaproteobacteria bacterium]